jgi:hypothetical protein
MNLGPLVGPCWREPTHRKTSDTATDVDEEPGREKRDAVRTKREDAPRTPA